MMVEMVIDSIRASPVNYQRVVILKEQATGRVLPIWIGPAEADAIAVKLHQVSLPRPLTHDLLRSVIAALGASLKFVVVCDLREDTFFAKLSLQVNGSEIEVDARPSDAMALAVRVEAPIYVDESVLSKAALVMDEETGKLVSAIPESRSPELSEEELKRLSAFRDFINSLDLQDFDDPKGKR
jgi:bifunctional DNase/RNase